MDAVEIADGDDGIAKRLGNGIEIFIDNHSFSGFTGYSDTSSKHFSSGGDCQYGIDNRKFILYKYR